MSCKAGLLFKAARKSGTRVRIFADRFCHGLRPVAVALTVAFTSLAHAAYADPIRGEATLTPQSNYARLVLQFEEDVPTEVTVAGSILVIQFRKQVAVPIDLLSEAAPAYVGSVRRDPDGTAIRDYIHVEDLCGAHVLALRYLRDGGASQFLNLGTGRGHSVREVIETARRVTGRPIATRLEGRRPGDPPRLIAQADKARAVLGWRPRYDDLETIIRSAWRWQEAHPNGYDGSR